MIFEIYWCWYEEYTPYLFEGKPKTQIGWKRDCMKAIRNVGANYIKKEIGWVGAHGWTEAACGELEKMGYTKVIPTNWGHFGSMIIRGDHEEDKIWKRIVGKELFNKTLKRNIKTEKECYKRVMKHTRLKESKDGSKSDKKPRARTTKRSRSV